MPRRPDCLTGPLATLDVGQRLPPDIAIVYGRGDLPRADEVSGVHEHTDHGPQ
jgi:hypothetical protein